MEDVDEAMSRYARGDATAFDAVYDALAPQLARYLRPRVRDEARLEDIIQQTFLQMHHARGNFVIGAAVMPWAFAIARRLMIDAGRRASARRTSSSTTIGWYRRQRSRPTHRPARRSSLRA